MEKQGARVTRAPLGPDADRGHFVRPTVIELPRASLLQREVFGPVLHVVRYPRNELPSVVDEIAGTGYGLTFGIQTRVDARAAAVADKIGAGNVYVNRNTIGAVVGSQPFGGQGLSGTGPKAGGPLYVARLRRETPATGGDPTPANPLPPVLATYRDWLLRRKEVEVAAACIRFANALSTLDATLPGPELESNVYRVSPRKGVLAIAATERGLLLQIAAALAAGIEVIQLESSSVALVSALPDEIRQRIRQERVLGTGLYDTALVEATAQAAVEIAGAIAAQRGGIVTVQVRTPDQIRAGELFDPRWLLHEQTICTNTAVNGGGSELVNRADAGAAAGAAP
jgi:RHH-type proline utilization regulon transcriptional repressor/proline dehydrogenase/delta 1-pyrroline-5-carboxylate dehydrogenase